MRYDQGEGRVAEWDQKRPGSGEGNVDWNVARRALEYAVNGRGQGFGADARFTALGTAKRRVSIAVFHGSQDSAELELCQLVI